MEGRDKDLSSGIDKLFSGSPHVGVQGLIQLLTYPRPWKSRVLQMYRVSPQGRPGDTCAET